MYAIKFRKITCDLSWDKATLMNQFQFGFCGNVKDLLLTMHDPTTLSQVIVQVVRCDNRFFECRQVKRQEPSPTLRQFTPPLLQPKHMVSAPNDNPMQIDKTQFKPFTKQEIQSQRLNNFCLYYGELGHITGAYPKKHIQHVACAITSTITQRPEEKGNEDIQSQQGP